MKSLNFHSTLFDCKLSKSFLIFFISENIKKKISVRKILWGHYSSYILAEGNFDLVV